MASTYTLISSQVLASSATSVTFSSIPSTYKDLVLRMSVRVSYVGNQYDNIKLTINSDTTNYSSTDLYGNSSSAASLRLTAETSMRLLNAANADATTTNTFSNVELYIPSYTSTSAKQFSTYSVLENNDSAANTAFILSMANLYRGTSAITQLALAPNFGTNFVSGSSFYLYGI